MSPIRQEAAAPTTSPAPDNQTLEISTGIDLAQAAICNPVARFGLPIVGNVVGAIGGAAVGTAAGTAVPVIGNVAGGMAGGILGSSAGAATVEAGLQEYCDGKINTAGVVTTAATGAVGGAFGAVFSIPARIAGQFVADTTGSAVTGAVVRGMVTGSGSALGQNTTNQSIEIGTGKRDEFDLGELALATSIGTATGGLMGAALPGKPSPKSEPNPSKPRNVAPSTDAPEPQSSTPPARGNPAPDAPSPPSLTVTNNPFPENAVGHKLYEMITQVGRLNTAIDQAGEHLNVAGFDIARREIEGNLRANISALLRPEGLQGIKITDLSKPEQALVGGYLRESMQWLTSSDRVMLGSISPGYGRWLRSVTAETKWALDTFQSLVGTES